eukprot:Sspe_Gene.91198::Locus_62674_Transcript_1_5_Confidence_0.429_Length_1386::g.91198::m.91198
MRSLGRLGTRWAHSEATAQVKSDREGAQLLRAYSFLKNARTLHSAHAKRKPTQELGRALPLKDPASSLLNDFYDLHNRGVAGVRTFTTAIAILAQCRGRIRQARKLFRLLKGSGLEPTVSTYNALLIGEARHRNADEALRLFKQMQETGVGYDIISLNAVLASLMRSRREGEVETMYLGYIGGLVPNLLTFNIRIAAARNVAEAVERFNDLVRSGTAPTQGSLGGVMRVCVRSLDAEVAEKVVKEAAKYHLFEDAVLWQQLMVVYCRLHRYREALAVWQRMPISCRGAEPTQYAYLAACLGASRAFRDGNPPDGLQLPAVIQSAERRVDEAIQHGVASLRIWRLMVELYTAVGDKSCVAAVKRRAQEHGVDPNSL